MENVIIASDTGDQMMGEFFEACSNDAHEYFLTHPLNVKLITGRQLNEASVNIITAEFPNAFFVAYSHGLQDSLLYGKGQYVSSTVNLKSFVDMLFYSCACHTATQLGCELIDNGCKNFIGYKDEFKVWDFNRAVFVECANHGLREFMSGKSISNVVQAMKDKYTEHIDNYNNDLIGAAVLVWNRSHLTWRGNDFSITDYN